MVIVHGEKGSSMKTLYIVTYDGEPITHIVINKDGVAIATDEDCEPIFFDMKETAVKMSLALTWAVGDWDFGWERIYV